MNKEILDTLNDLSKRPTTELAMRLMKTTVDNMKKDKEIKRLDNIINKAIEYINRHKKPLNHSFDEPDCDYWIATNPDELLNILQGSDE